MVVKRDIWEAIANGRYDLGWDRENGWMISIFPVGKEGKTITMSERCPKKLGETI